MWAVQLNKNKLEKVIVTIIRVGSLAQELATKLRTHTPRKKEFSKYCSLADKK